MRIFSFGGYGLAHAPLTLVVFGAIECPPSFTVKALALRNPFLRLYAPYFKGFNLYRMINSHSKYLIILFVLKHLF